MAIPIVPLQWCRIDPDGPGLHSPKRAGDVGWDLEAAEDAVLGYHEQKNISTNVRVALPDNCWGEIRARSSISLKGLQVDAGVLDNGYTGPLLVLLRNMNGRTHRPEGVDEFGQVYIKRGQRIAQLVLHWAVWADGYEVDKIWDDPRRGTAGFGSTGA